MTMTDKEKWNKFLGEYLKQAEYNIHVNSISIDPDDTQGNVKGDTWSGFEVFFNDDESFKHIFMIGD
ncbi:hypothetical protein LCGC14_1031840 [marine sediment metagenome]|uniref:Uncharacterized protein n=1 Tax=marine sediment metagenome TaxID=412755 RepID=A0A0F9MYW0_9ZZZZ